MKAIRAGRSFGIPPVRLSLEDIEEVIGILRGLDAKVEVATRDAEYESIGELIEHEGVRPKSLTISVPAVVLQFNSQQVEGGKSASRLESRSSTDDKVEQCFLQVRERLLDRRKWYWIFSSPITFVTLGVALLAYALTSTKGDPQAPLTREGVIVVLVFVALTVGLLTPWLSGRAHTVELVPRKEMTSWWARHGHELLIAAVSALITGAVTILFCR